MEKKIFGIVADLNKHFNGDTVLIDAVLGSPYDDIGHFLMTDDDLEYIKQTYTKYGVEPAEVKKFIIGKGSSLSGEDILYAYLHEMSIDDYLQSDAAEDVFIRRERRWDDWGKPSGYIDEERVYKLIESIESFYFSDDDLINSIFENGYSGITNPDALEEVKAIFESYWLTPGQVKNWLLEKGFSVWDVIQAIDNDMRI